MPQSEPRLAISNLENLREQAGYSLVVARIETLIRQAQERLEQAGNEQDMYRYQGQIKAYRTALKLPDILVSELKERVKDE